jgi:ribonuclease BN (tRNA processing enzyme)
MPYSIVINGLDNAYIRELGCPCDRCKRQNRAANTSVSILETLPNGRAKRHLLVDAGAGVRESLMSHAVLRPDFVLDGVLLTHWHVDHTCELTHLAVTLARSRAREGKTLAPIPVWCRYGSERWLQKNLLEKAPMELRSFGHLEPSGVLLEPVPVGWAGMQVTPVTISHSSADISPNGGSEDFPSCCGYLLEFANGVRVALLWDMDVNNTWLEYPNAANLETIERLRGVDHLFIDSNTWLYDQNKLGRPASHLSFAIVRRFARILEPKQTWLMHLSGHEDQPETGFGWDDSTWRHEAKRAWSDSGLNGNVDVPIIGQTISLEPQLESAMLTASGVF